MQGLQLLNTSHGPHPPEKWATASTAHIIGPHGLIKVEPTVTGSRLAEVKTLEAAIYAVLLAHHASVAEQAQQSNSGKVEIFPSSAVNKIVGLIFASPFAEAASRSEVEAAVRRTVLRHSESNAEVHRLHREATNRRT